MQNHLEWDWENRRLAQTIAIAREEFASLRLRSEANKAAIIAAKQDMREDTSHAIANLWSMENFHELVALSQYASPVSEKVTEYERDADRILALERLINSPYFARIDFQFAGEDSFEPIYIGRSSLRDDQTRTIAVYDWRSPIAGVFYRFGTGKVFYASPGGQVTGEVNLKRQYEISRGKLAYFFDADVQIVDEFLRKLLSQNASPQMKTIVETIQKDQDLIIRDLETALLMVQGAAGSGKTSVALHRIAYLMYQGLAAKLSSNDILIISPHSLFERYISHVLPELGEKNVRSLVFEDILRQVLQREAIQTRHQFLEGLLSAANEDRTIRHHSMAFKGSRQFAQILDRFLAELPDRWLPFADVYYDGQVVAGRHLLKEKIRKSNPKSLLGPRLKQLENSLWQSIHDRRQKRLAKLKTFIREQTMHAFEVEAAARRLSIRESSVLRQKIRQFTELDCLALYRQLFRDKKAFYRLAQGSELPACIEEIIDFTCENLKKEELLYEDALALVFLQVKTKGAPGAPAFRQVVIDEAQDYYPLHFAILKDLFPQARYTILGDIRQTIGKEEDPALYDQVREILGKPQAALMTLDKSFRSTKEILTYSARLLGPDAAIRSFSRQGDAPAVFAAPDQAALDRLLLAEIAACQAKAYQSVGLICKTAQHALAVYARLQDRIAIQLITSDAQADLSGPFLIPVYLAKGLEFDAVLICDADQQHYHRADDKNLLYIACTRALHRLNLFYTGAVSPLLPSP